MHWRLAESDAEVYTSSPEQTVPNVSLQSLHFSTMWSLLGDRLPLACSPVRVPW